MIEPSRFTGFRAAALATSALIVLATAAPARAQNAADATTTPPASPAVAAPGGGDGSDIVVTARRRNESLERVPIAVTAISGAQLTERNIRTDSDLQLSAPGLTIRQTQGNNSLTYSLRGQSADTFSGSPSAVVTYLNEVPLTISGASTFFDLESVQVLKGPQGTLFGRNATGGAVLYTSAKPTDKFEGMIRGRFGNLNYREGDGMINIPIVDDKILFRGAFDIDRRHGYIFNYYDDSHIGADRRESYRGSLTLKPTETITNNTVLQFSRTHGTNTGASYTYSIYAPGQTNNGYTLNSSVGGLFNPGLDAIFGPGAWEAYLAAHPDAYAPGLIAYVQRQKELGYYTTYYPGDPVNMGRDWNLSNTTTIPLTDDLTFKNIFGWSRSDVRSVQPQSGAPFVTILTVNVDTGQAGNQLHIRSLSDEPQLQGKGLGGSLTYIIGGYFQNQRSDTIWPQTYFDLSPVLAPSTATNAFRIYEHTRALYGQATYDLGAMGLDGVKLTAGLRYTWERFSTYHLIGEKIVEKKNFSDPSWEVGLEYQATPQLFTYIKTRGSFRSGGFNGGAPQVLAPASEGGNVFGSEHTQDIEAGVKYHGRAFDRPVVINLAVYNQWIQNVQRVEFPDPDGPGGLASIAVTANIPSERVRGFELEASLMPAPWLEVGGSMAYTDAKFTDGRINLFGVNYLYGPVGDTPKTSGSFYAQFDAPMDKAMGSIHLRGEVYAQTHQFFSNAYGSIAPGTKLPGYALVNARLGWDQVMGTGFSGALFAKNMLNKAYFAGGMTLASSLGQNAAAVGEPRTYGVELSYKF